MNRVGSSVESTFEATGLLDTSSVFFCYWWDEVGADPCVVAVMSDLIRFPRQLARGR